MGVREIHYLYIISCSTLAGPILTEQQIMKLAQLKLGVGYSIYPK